MTKSMVLGKYPVFSLEVSKELCRFSKTEEIVNDFKEKIDTHPVATFIAVFDHYAHTQSIKGEIEASIKDVKNVVFCFGKAIPNTKIAAARPRSIAVCELENAFSIEFMEAPNEQLTDVMKSWAESIKK